MNDNSYIGYILVALFLALMVLLMEAPDIVDKIAKGERLMKLSDRAYTILKWVLSVAVAPTIALITGLGQLYGFDTFKIVETISLIATFLGALFGISVYQYNKEA